ncbi:uncharacterized protein EAF01_002409 [Botrytis porri]|uniref:uncharacterized protein n=1 Tax=Botrytis porri TaxID=87229 RepID=UPI001900514B|nr:uncharacterized protein EAF01_002409 [Botrytis porri]KAF7910900.1 hypothetical protein EAF01_002409 [Botrytis porri]
MDHLFSLPSNSKPYHNNGTVDFEHPPISDEDLQMWGDLDCLELATSSNLIVGCSSPGWAPQWMAGSEEYQELSAPSSYNSHPSFPSPPASTPVAKDRNYGSSAWINTVQNNGTPIATANNLNVMYPTSMPGEWSNRYNVSAYQRTAENATQDNNTAS